MSLTILTVIEDAPPPIQPERQRGRFGSSADAETYIEELVKQWHHMAPGVDGEVVRDPISVAGGLRLHLQERPAGLVAVTTHARSGMQRARLGATAASIVHASVAPCLVAPVDNVTPHAGSARCVPLEQRQRTRGAVNLGEGR